MTANMPHFTPCVQCDSPDQVITIKLGPNRHIAYCSNKPCNNITPVISTQRRTAIEVWNALQNDLKIAGWTGKKEAK